jgi:hypothetical protein
MSLSFLPSSSSLYSSRRNARRLAAALVPLRWHPAHCRSPGRPRSPPRPTVPPSSGRWTLLPLPPPLHLLPVVAAASPHGSSLSPSLLTSIAARHARCGRTMPSRRRRRFSCGYRSTHADPLPPPPPAALPRAWCGPAGVGAARTRAAVGGVVAQHRGGLGGTDPQGAGAAR